MVRISIVLMLLVALAPVALADGSRVFISTSASSPTEVSDSSNPTIRIPEGASVSLYLWWQPGGSDVVESLSHDVVLSDGILTRDSDPDVAEDYIVDNPSIAGASRWQGIDTGSFGGTFLVNDANAFKIGGSNLGTGGESDPFFDAASGAYRLSKLPFTGTEPGTTELRIAVGNGGIGILDHPADTEILFGFDDDGVAGNDKGSASTLADATVEVVAIDLEKPWQNPAQREDVNADLVVTPLDALIIINELNDRGPFDVTVPTTEEDHPPPFFDPSGNNAVAPQDALIVVDFLNDQTMEGLTTQFAQPVVLDVFAVPEPTTGWLAIVGVALLSVYFGSRRLRFS